MVLLHLSLHSSKMYRSFLLLPILFLTYFTHAAPAPPNTNTPLSLAHPAHHPINSTNDINFLGVDCYSLDPAVASISLLECQPLFAWMMSGGDVYQPHTFWNGWRFKKAGHDPCLVTITSRNTKDKSVRISYANIVLKAHEVLEQCRTGGANDFGGNWSIMVTRGVVTEGIREG